MGMKVFVRVLAVNGGPYSELDCLVASIFVAFRFITPGSWGVRVQKSEQIGCSKTCNNGSNRQYTNQLITGCHVMHTDGERAYHGSVHLVLD